MGRRELLARVKKRKLKDTAIAYKLCAHISHQFTCCLDGSARRDQVVQNQHGIFRADGIGVDLDRIRSILELVALADRLARQFARLTCGNKALKTTPGSG